MQLGTRWTIRGQAPAGLPQAVLTAISGVEAEVFALASAEFDPSGWRWTLTWLEGRPVVELEDGTVIRYDAAADVAAVIPGE